MYAQNTCYALFLKIQAIYSEREKQNHEFDFERKANDSRGNRAVEHKRKKNQVRFVGV